MRGLQIPSEVISKLNVPQIVDITDQLPVNKNYTWSQLAGTRDINDLTCVAWHHDDIAKSLRSGKDNLTVAKGIAQNHIDLKRNEPKGDAGFPYHFWIRNGQAYQCNDILDRTYGVGSNNAYTVHVCVDGSYAGVDQLEDADKRALMAVTLTLMRVLPNYQAIKAHGELNPTDCPGYDYATIRTETVNMDMMIKQENSWEGKKKRVADLVNQVNYMTGLMKAGPDDGTAQWAVQQLIGAADVMKSLGLL